MDYKNATKYQFVFNSFEFVFARKIKKAGNFKLLFSIILNKKKKKNIYYLVALTLSKEIIQHLKNDELEELM